MLLLKSLFSHKQIRQLDPLSSHLNQLWQTLPLSWKRDQAASRGTMQHDIAVMEKAQTQRWYIYLKRSLCMSCYSTLLCSSLTRNQPLSCAPIRGDEHFTRQSTATTEQAWKWHRIQERWSFTALCSWHHAWILQVTPLQKAQSIPTTPLHEATVNFNSVSGLYKLLWKVDKNATKSQSDGTGSQPAAVPWPASILKTKHNQGSASPSNPGDCLLCNTNTSKERMPMHEDKPG